MSNPTLYGATYSVYARIARLALIEKGVPFRFEEIDIFADVPADYLVRHPFKRIPALEHDGLSLYETAAITRYVDEAFDGPALQPKDPRDRARMAQAIGVIDQYLYWPAVRVVYVQRIGRPKEGEASDEAAIAAALPEVETALGALEKLADSAPWLVGERISLADLHLAPAIDYFERAPEGAELLGRYAGLSGWWKRMRTRPSVEQTPFVTR